MQTKPLTALFLSVLGFLTQSATAGGAWYREPGTGYMGLGYTSVGTRVFYTPDRAKLFFHSYSLHQVDLYAEYGLRKDLTLALQVPWRSHRWMEAPGVPEENVPEFVGGTKYIHRIGDATLDFHYRLSKGPVPFAAGLGVRIPSGDAQGSPQFVNQEEIPVSRRDSLVLPTGTDEWSLLFSIHSLKIFLKTGYVTATAGYTLSTRYVDSWNAGLQVGYRYLWFVPWASLRMQYPIAERAVERLNFIGTGEGVSFVSPGIGLTARVDRLSLGYAYNTGLGKYDAVNLRPRNLYAASHSSFHVGLSF